MRTRRVLALLTGCLIWANPSEASDRPLNIAIGGVRTPAMTADLVHVNESPLNEILPDSLQTLGILRDAVADPILMPISAIVGVPVAVKEKRHRASHYLAEGLGEGFEAMPWQGVFTKGPERKEAIENFARALIYQSQAEPGRPINIVCHSHGCGIALEAFAIAGEEGVCINKFVTTGTRLTGLPGDNQRDKPENVGEWVNIYSRHDHALSKELDGKGIFNVEFTGGDAHPHLGISSGHGLYYKNDAVRGSIRDIMDGNGRAEDILRERHAETFVLPEPAQSSPRG